MDKKRKKGKLKIFNIVAAIMLTLICAFTFTGCQCSLMDDFGGDTLPPPSSGGGSGNGGSSGGSGSGSGGGGSSSGSTGGSTDTDDGDFEMPEYETPAGSVDNFNDVLRGALVAYEVASNEAVYYDRYKDTAVDYETLADRQFTSMATYLYSTLNRIYGVPDAEPSSTMTITGYGADKTLAYNSTINDNNQKIISGISSGTLANVSRLNYANSIAGGYDLVLTVDNANSSYTWNYDTATIKSENAWKSGSATSFSIASLKNALCYIYNNQFKVSNADNVISFASDADIDLKNYYKNINSANISTNTHYANIGNIKELGLNRAYLWNVAYYLAFSIIGEKNINNSIDYFNTVFTGNSIGEIVTFAVDPETSENVETSNEVAFESYKGYNIVLNNIVENIAKLIVDGETVISVASGDASWDKTLFPSLSRIYYEFIDDVNVISEAYNDDDFFGEGGGDYEWDPDAETEESPVDPGPYRKLKQIILIPQINPSGKFDGEVFKIGGAFMGMTSEDGEEYQVKATTNGYCNGEAFASDAVFDGEGVVVDGALVINDVYTFFDNAVDMSFEVSGEFSNVSTLNGIDIEDIITNSFTIGQRTVNYPLAGSSATFNYGAINVYNQLFVDGNINLSHNYISINFEYLKNGNPVETPMVSLMYFLIYN